jgi:GH24 family phage-related lysozyme (muramidase)
MVGFMRQPQMINDPNAAPASMRADDVDLQAQEGDFIMGYPAMQKSGTKVRSLVEQAMLKAKDAGVKTKGYKQGDKVDILVHNGEMQIPKELVSYVEGGYTTLKKLNSPSKYDEGDVVLPNYSAKPMDNIPDEFAEPDNRIKNNIESFPTDMTQIDTIQETETKRKKYPVEHPTIGSLLFAGDNPVRGKMAWERANKVMKNIFMKDKEFSDKPKEANNRLYIEAMGNLKKAIESGVDIKSQFSGERLVNPQFLKNVARSTQLSHLIDKANWVSTGERLQPNYNVTPFGIKAIYAKGTPGLMGKEQTGIDNTERKLSYTFDESFNPEENFHRRDAMRFQAKHNIKDSNINSSGGTGYSGADHKIKFNKDYNKVFNYLKRDNIEGFRSEIYDDAGHPAIGYGHRLTSKASVENYKRDGITQEQAEDLLAKDIMEAENNVRVVYNKFIKDKKFTGTAATKFRNLDANRKAMLVEMSFNMGASKISPSNKDGFPKFFKALAHNDYETMSQEYHRKGVGEPRNKEFLEEFINPKLGKINLKERLNA